MSITLHCWQNYINHFIASHSLLQFLGLTALNILCHLQTLQFTAIFKLIKGSRKKINKNSLFLQLLNKNWFIGNDYFEKKSFYLVIAVLWSSCKPCWHRCFLWIVFFSLLFKRGGNFSIGQSVHTRTKSPCNIDVALLKSLISMFLGFLQEFICTWTLVRIYLWPSGII